MIVDHLQRFARKIAIDVVSSLLSGEMGRVFSVAERCFMKREERGIAALDSSPAGFALAQVIAGCEQFHGGQATAHVVLNLFLSQVFHLSLV